MFLLGMRYGVVCGRSDTRLSPLQRRSLSRRSSPAASETTATIASFATATTSLIRKSLSWMTERIACLILSSDFGELELTERDSLTGGCNDE